MIRVLEVRPPFGPAALRYAQRLMPEPGPTQIVIRLLALSLNFRDLLVINGENRWRPSGPRVPVSDGVGEVVAIGDRVTRVRVGDRVAPIFYPLWIEGYPAPERLDRALGGAMADGLYAEQTVADESAVVHVPPHLTDEEAATLPCAGVTAWQGVAEQGRVRAGDWAVVLGTGGVALFALQFARLMGVRVIVTSSSDAKLERAVALGAWAGINYRTTPEWPRRVLELTGGRGVDLVVDTAGSLPEAVNAVRVGGTVAYIGLLTGTKSTVDLVALMGKSARIQAIDVGSRAMFEAMNRAVEAERLRPVVDRTFGFDEAMQAFRYLAGAGHFGKICIRL